MWRFRNMAIRGSLTVAILVLNLGEPLFIELEIISSSFINYNTIFYSHNIHSCRVANFSAINLYIWYFDVLNFINKGKLFKVRDASIWLMFLNFTIINK